NSGLIYLVLGLIFNSGLIYLVLGLIFNSGLICLVFRFDFKSFLYNWLKFNYPFLDLLDIS
ncbi:hypothetical protein, partial [uncultured Methanobrevibacter sp.]|uniref:hypothetical protein n=1 Tax=uncultured Methanobrevibacter sp. TaxID=253161 RepID=UPI0026222CC2